ncbi:MAG: hypothetical protein DI533_15210 [Cereibacter sphaeroides]|uniref:Uncharacterized protein n=1 Tax=Cereibacter sphaeroides TaxID=1063 RepID=A0A2W5TME8_CERSP|nr:MAG: hypothetical protein DI533_15210 [Cereibacter sphaeroides]
MTSFVAERKLLYSKKDSEARFEFAVRIGMPYIVDDGIGESASCCRIYFEGLDEQARTIFGMDSLQAVNLASDVEHLLEWLHKKYDIFWLTGEPYFDE